jgi:hypothetical protein
MSRTFGEYLSHPKIRKFQDVNRKNKQSNDFCIILKFCEAVQVDSKS